MLKLQLVRRGVPVLTVASVGWWIPTGKQIPDGSEIVAED